MRFFFTFFLVMIAMSAVSQSDYIKLSQDLLYAVKTGELTDSFENQFSLVPQDVLFSQLDSENKRKAFWLNIYNAYTQIALKKTPGAYTKRNKFFSRKFISIAGKNISLDLAEHGILRRSKWKYSLGHFNKLFKSAFEKKFRLDKVDYRIHFALNCGAKSCPPIAFYEPGLLDKQLDLATKIYLRSEVVFNAAKNTVEVPAILGWFRGDFNGKKGILKILKEQKLVPPDSTPKIIWKKYDWTLALKNYNEEDR
jgi:hypothetical protein